MPFFAIAALLPLFPLDGSALTVRTRADLRYWETVTDRSAPLRWSWEDKADSARLTFCNRLTENSSSVVVERQPGASCGSGSQPSWASVDVAYVDVSLVQLSAGVEIAQQTAVLAYVPGAAGCPLTVRTEQDRDWCRVVRPQLAGFDADWWNVPGPSGYEIFKLPADGQRRFVREFVGAGVVDEVVLVCGKPCFWMSLR